MVIKSKLSNKREYDKTCTENNFKINDKVLIVGNNNKLQRIYDGPYTVTAIEDCNAIVTDPINNKTKTVHLNKLIKYTKG